MRTCAWAGSPAASIRQAKTIARHPITPARSETHAAASISRLDVPGHVLAWLLEASVHGVFLGSLSLTSLGLVLASRGTSEEFTTGILNFISWPMMFLSEVWFSMEGAPAWVKTFAKIFHLVQPDVFIDNHVSNGADYQYKITHLFTQHNKLGGTLGNYLHKTMQPTIEK